MHGEFKTTHHSLPYLLRPLPWRPGWPCPAPVLRWCTGTGQRQLSRHCWWSGLQWATARDEHPSGRAGRSSPSGWSSWDLHSPHRSAPRYPQGERWHCLDGWMDEADLAEQRENGTGIKLMIMWLAITQVYKQIRLLKSKCSDLKTIFPINTNFHRINMCQILQPKPSQCLQ